MVIPASSNLFDSPTVWGTKIESKTGGLYPRNEKQQPSKLMRNGKGATQEPHGKASAIASSVITAALPTSVVHRNEGVPIISKTQSASSNMRLIVLSNFEQLWIWTQVLRSFLNYSCWREGGVIVMPVLAKLNFVGLQTSTMRII